MTKRALITGITGQDGTYLAELLLKKNYQVFGIGQKHFNQSDIKYLSGDINNDSFLHNAISEIQPDEVYNLASQSYPGESWNIPLETAHTNGMGAHLLFETIRQIKPTTRIYQASSSDMFGEVLQTPQDEKTPFNPTNPYSVAKLYAHHIATIYRKSYNMFISCGILFNHESPRRGMHFITQKVAYAAACLKLGIKQSTQLNERGEPIVKDGKLSLGNLDAKRDWGFAGDYVEAMWLMLQQNQPDDFVIGTGKLKSIKNLCEVAFSYVGLNWQDHVVIDQKLFRPNETGDTVANPIKAKKLLNWEAKKSFEAIIFELIENHLQKLNPI